MQKLTCIVCPNGCELEVDVVNGEYKVTGNMCKRGIDFAINEIENPTRSICSTVKTVYKEIPRLPVRTNGEVPVNLIFKVMEEINRLVVAKPVHTGDILIKDVLGTGVDIIATSDTYYWLQA